MANKETKSNKDKKNGFKEFKAELKKVIWPTKEQLAKNTIAVVSIVLGTAVLVFVLDFAFEALNKYGISKVQSLYVESYTNPEEGNIEAIDQNEDNEEEENNETPESTEQESEENETTNSDTQNVEVEQTGDSTEEQNQ